MRDAPADVSVLFVEHVPSNVERIVQHIPRTFDLTYIVGVELAIDDYNPNNDARRRVAEIQAELIRFIAGTDLEMDYIKPDGFFGTLASTVVREGRGDIVPLLIDAGRTTNGKEGLDRITKSYHSSAIERAWNECGGNSGTYIGIRGYDVADSCEFRETLDAEQIASILSVNPEPLSVIVGAEHYGIIPLLHKKNITTKAIVVDRPFGTSEMAVANQIRCRGDVFNEKIMMALGLAEWLSTQEEKAGRLFIKLKELDIKTLERIAQQFYRNPDTECADSLISQYVSIV